MKIYSIAMMSAAVVTGLAGAGVAYEIASAGQDDADTAVTDALPVDDTATAGVVKPRKRWAPCEPPAVLEGRTCVTDEVRTVVLPAPWAQDGAVAPRDGDGDGAGRDEADRAFDDRDDDREDQVESHDDDGPGDDHSDSGEEDDHSESGGEDDSGHRDDD